MMDNLLECVQRTFQICRWPDFDCKLAGVPHLLCMLELEEALARILEVVPLPVIERVPLQQAHGRVLLERVLSPLDLPPFDNSAMDGYAVRAEDVASAKPGSPVRLRVLGKASAGEVFPGKVQPGDCVRIFTGSPLPRGANAVVMQEDTQVATGRAAEVQMLKPALPRENVRRQGEDFRRGAVLAEAGERLSTGRLSLLGAAGLAIVAVGRQPVTGLLATGSELKEPGQPLEPGQIYDSNRIGLQALIQLSGATPKRLPLVPDTLADTRNALRDAFDQCDVVVNSGGVSVGEIGMEAAVDPDDGFAFLGQGAGFGFGGFAQGEAAADVAPAIELAQVFGLLGFLFRLHFFLIILFRLNRNYRDGNGHFIAFFQTQVIKARSNFFRYDLQIFICLGYQLPIFIRIPNKQIRM